MFYKPLLNPLCGSNIGMAVVLFFLHPFLCSECVYNSTIKMPVVQGKHNRLYGCFSSLPGCNFKTLSSPCSGFSVKLALQSLSILRTSPENCDEFWVGCSANDEDQTAVTSLSGVFRRSLGG